MRAAGMPAVGADRSEQSVRDGEVLRAALGAGIKPIIGVDLLVRESGERGEPSRLVLLCQNGRATRTSRGS